MKPVLYVIQPLHEDQVQALAVDYPQYDVYTAWQGLPAERKADVEIILGGKGNDSDAIMAVPNNRLKWIQGRSAGVDFWDLAKLKAAGVMLSNAAGLHGDAIAEHVMGMLLLDVRDLRQILTLQAKHEWGRDTVVQRPLAGQTMLILGVGRVGARVGQLAAAFKLNVVGVDKFPKPHDGFSEVVPLDRLPEILPTADFIVNTLPLTPETTHFYDDAFFAQVRPGAKFVNVGRGTSMDTQAVIRALKAGKLSNVYLDVYETEPLPADDPLWQLPNVVLSPHVAGMTPKFKTHLLNEIFLPNLAQFVTNGDLLINRIV
ncbi:NAD(P)-dependent oxidoreductase [Lacticaseibacillus parakribbianus]|uniref:NAD(P)-dependent oxidoreductase n=1 Tax=Lacticaseibacillus parakribbianus TaxID=2970927 RepID=UPI0021CB5411|nr:NAD(P)-dependent oxidoreductase [Lacticaseibacillus parakribbianus]